MLVVIKNAEEALLKEVGHRAQTDLTCRCLYWRTSQLGDKRDAAISQILYYLENVLLGNPGQAYICHDGDLFVVIRALTNKILAHILFQISSKLGPVTAFSELADLFEIGVDHQKILKLGKTKLETRKAQEQKTKPVLKENIQIDHQALKQISEKMTGTLSQRRIQRNTPEIMVVEDDAFSQRLMENALGEKYSLKVASDGQGALMAYVTHAPDVLFLDIGLPDMDGHAVLERIFKVDPDAYIVMFSGNGSRENILRAIELGAKGFIGKPFTKDKLFQYIEKSPFIQRKQIKEFANEYI